VIQQISPAVVRYPEPPLSPTQLTATVTGLVDALVSEHRLIEELIAIMRRQREAVAKDDLQSVDDSVYAIQRVLFTLGEARKRRRTLNRRLGTAEDLALRDLESVLGTVVTPELLRAREALQHSARTLSQEVAVNRKVLREALAAGDDYVRLLFGGPAHPTSYPESTGKPERAGSAGGYLINRRA
jgi:hypothetical protein